LHSAFLEEIYVCALGRKHFVMTNGGAVPPDIDIVDLRDWNDNVRHPAVDKMNGFGFACDLQRNIQPQIARRRHLQRHQFTVKLGRNHAGRSLKGNLPLRAGNFVCKSRKAARAVAAHFRFTAVAVKVAHPEVRPVSRFFEQQNSIGADAAVTIANARDLRGIEMNFARTIVDHHEIVSGAVHFRETQHSATIVVAAVLSRKLWSRAREDKRL